MNSATIQRASFLLLLALSTLAFFWVLAPFSGAVLWSLALAIVFQPLYQWWLHRLKGRANLAAATTLALVMVVVVIPLGLIALSLVQDIVEFALKVRSGEISLYDYFQRILAALPGWATSLLDRAGLHNIDDMVARVSASAKAGSQLIAVQALTFGRSTFDFLVSFAIMLYVLFFLLRDGMGLQKKVRESLPLTRPHTHFLLNKFTIVVRATIKGNVIVALVQGALGGLALWALGVQGPLLWGTVMAFFSLLPAVGAAVVWVPVAVYFFATGHAAKGAGLVAFGVLVIGLVDNLLRPVLVGKDTQMPDYMVLLSTVGGIALFGISGFVIGPVIAAVFLACWDLFSRSNETDGNAPVSPPPET